MIFGESAESGQGKKEIQEVGGSFEYAKSPEEIKVKVALVIIEKDGKFLIGRRTEGRAYAGKWEFPGGKIEENETPENCVAREVQEELGVPIEQIEPYIEWDYKFPDGNFFHLIGFRGMFSGEPEMKVHSELRWVTPSELVDYDFLESDKILVDALKNAK